MLEEFSKLRGSCINERNDRTKRNTEFINFRNPYILAKAELLLPKEKFAEFVELISTIQLESIRGRFAFFFNISKVMLYWLLTVLLSQYYQISTQSPQSGCLSTKQSKTIDFNYIIFKIRFWS